MVNTGSTTNEFGFLSNNFFVSPDGTERLRIDSSGNVGINTTSPSAALEVSGSAKITGDGQSLTVDQVSGSGGAGVILKSTGANLPFVRWTDGTTNIAGMRADDSGKFHIQTNGFNNRLTIDSSGNVGIGTTSPDVPLEVVSASPTDGIVADFVNSTNAGGTIAAIKLSNADSENCDVVLGANRVGANFGSDFFISLSSSADGSNQERFRITEAGNVGIGTTSPQKQLHVNSGTGNIGIRVESTDSEAEIEFMDNATTDTLNSPRIGGKGNDLFMQTNGSERMRIDSSGNVGIGTNSPTNKLHVLNTGTTAISNALANSGAILDGGTGNIGLNMITPNTGACYINFGDSADSNIGRLIYNHNNNAMTFDTNAEERMRIDSSGNVGIGTAIPEKKLHVEGDVRIKSAFPRLYLTDTDNNSDYSIINNNGQFSIYDDTNTEYRMAIDSSGNVGIGTTSPSTKLDVNGDVAVRGSVPLIFLEETDTTNLNTSLANNSGAFNIDTANDGNTAGTTRLSVDHATGDITFHGATDSMFFDASAGNLGLGTTTPTSAIHISETTPIIRLEDTNYTNKIGEIKHSNGVTSIQSRNGSDNGRIVFEGNNGSVTSERMRIDGSGNLLIGTTTGSGKLVVDLRIQRHQALSLHQ
jgi:hypothetical protein